MPATLATHRCGAVSDAQTPSRWSASRWLGVSVAARFPVATLCQLFFVTYVIGLYGRSPQAGEPELALLTVLTLLGTAARPWARGCRSGMLDAKTRAARQHLYHCTWLVAQSRDVVQDVSLKALTGELAGKVVQTCQQFHGGMGNMRHTPIERLWRDARILAIGGGATEVMLDEAAKRY